MNRIKRLLNANLISTLSKETWRATLTIYQLKEDLFTELMMGDEQLCQMLFEWNSIIVDENGNQIDKVGKHYARRQQVQLEGWQLNSVKWAVVKVDPMAILLDDGDDEAVAEVFRQLNCNKRQPSGSLEKSLIRWLGY